MEVASAGRAGEAYVVASRPPMSADEWEDLYEREAASFPLLTSSEELEHGARVWRGWHMTRVALATLDADALRMLAYSLVDMKDAAHTLIHHNLRLVIAHARQWRGGAGGGGLNCQDLVQEGNKGLCHAAWAFDYRKGFRFSTFATWWIRQAVSRAIAEKSRAIHIPVYVHGALSKGRRLVRDYQVEVHDTDAAPPDEWLLAHGMQAYELRAFREYVAPVIVSLDEPLSDWESADPLLLADALEGPPLGYSVDDVEAREAADALEAAVRRILTKREAFVILARAGYLYDGRKLTLTEVGGALRVSRERARQVEDVALRKLYADGLRTDGSIGARRSPAEVAAMVAARKDPQRAASGRSSGAAKKRVAATAC